MTRSFRIYPEPESKLYFRVTVFPSLLAMRAYGRKTFDSPSGRAIAWCGTFKVQAFPRRGRAYTRRICGEILLVAQRLGVGIISHECTHAALGYARRRRFDPRVSNGDGGPVGPGEERLCHVQGELVRQLVAKLFKYRLLVESAPTRGVA